MVLLHVHSPHLIKKKIKMPDASTRPTVLVVLLSIDLPRQAHASCSIVALHALLHACSSLVDGANTVLHNPIQENVFALPSPYYGLFPYNR